MSASLQMLFTMKYSMMRSALLEWDRANPAVSRSSAVSFSERQRDRFLGIGNGVFDSIKIVASAEHPEVPCSICCAVFGYVSFYLLLLQCVHRLPIYGQGYTLSITNVSTI